MIVSTLSFAALVALATAHGNHGQKPIAGPHKSLWYNTLPGDGGTQVWMAIGSSSAERCDAIDWPLCLAGGRCLLWHLHVRAAAVLSMSCQRRGEIWHCVHRYVCFSSMTNPCCVVRCGQVYIYWEDCPIRSADCSSWQARPSTRALRTDQAPALVPAASDKVLAVSISSMFCLQKAEAYLFDQKGSRKLGFSGGYNVPLEANPFHNEFKILDCGDIPVTSYVYAGDNKQWTNSTDDLLVTTTPGRSSRSKMDTTPSSCASLTQTQTRRVSRRPARCCHGSSPWEATTPSRFPCCAVSTRHMGRWRSFTLTAICEDFLMYVLYSATVPR